MKDVVIDGYNGYLANDESLFVERVLTIINDKKLRDYFSDNAKKQFDRLNDVSNYKKVIYSAYRG